MAGVLMPNFTSKRLEQAAVFVPAAGGSHLRELRELPGVAFGEGVTGLAYQQGELLVIQDVRAFPPYIDHSGGKVRSEVAVPLLRGEEVVGILDVQRVEMNAFSPNDIAMLSLFASQGAIAIENSQLFAEQQRRVHELQTIQSLVQKLTLLQEIDAIADLIDAELGALISYNHCRLFVLSARQRLVQVGSGVGDTLGFQPRVGEGMTGWIALHGKSALVPNLLEDPRSMTIPGTTARPESLIGAPLIYEGRVRGVITLTMLGVAQFDENSLRLLEIIAAQAAIAIDRTRLYDELRTEAVTDELTKLYNRRYLFERFKEERSRAIRNRHNLVALMLDIDRFKVVNDAHGHDAGDIVLRELAEICRALVRAEDIVTRYGGEEFCLLLPEIPLEDAKHVAERLRQTIAEHEMPPTAGIKHITVSLGMALLQPGDGDTELFTRADLAMYEVKKRGGDGVHVDS
jgi:diguanylate cyclase (GGDEF)-like protein